METPAYCLILDEKAMFHIGVLLMNETHAPSPPAAISQPKIHANALALGKLTAIPRSLSSIWGVSEAGLGL